MPNRLIREGLMESERVLALPVEARWLFVIIVLSADDVGLFEATEFKLARRADVNRDLAGTLLSMLSDQDLVRFYVVDGKRFGFIPRFRQRIQLKRMKHPAPPVGLMSDDNDALNKINDLASRTSVGQPLDNGCADDGQPSEAKAEAEEEREIVATQRRPRVAVAKSGAAAKAEVTTQHQLVIDLYNAKLADAIDGALRPRRAEGVGAKGRATAIAAFLGLAKARVAAKNPNGGKDALATWLGKYFDRAANDDFIAGRVTRRTGNETWRASLEHVIGEKTFLRLVEA